MMRRVILLALALALLCAMPCASAATGGEASAEGFFRMDRDSRAAWTNDLANLRLLTKGQYKFGKAKKRYGIDPDYAPSTKGLNRLNISGSAQFSRSQFIKLAMTLRKLADGKQIYIVDLRQESHAFLDGNPFSWYSEHNWANLGKTVDEVRKDEEVRFGTLIGKTIKAYGVSHDQKTGKTSFAVKSFMTEEDLAAQEGFGYLRIPAPDLCWPPAEQIDAFIEFVKGIDMKQTWLHFHCHAGTGRTGIFMMLYDKMKNPKVSMKDITIRQALTGSEYPLYSSNSTKLHGQLNAEKARMTPLLFEYVEKNYKSNYAVSWSEWLADHGD